MRWPKEKFSRLGATRCGEATKKEFTPGTLKLEKIYGGYSVGYVDVEIQKRDYELTQPLISIYGGSDGARTRNLRRDRPTL